MKKSVHSALAAGLCSAAAQGGFIGWHAEASIVSSGGQGYCVVDIYAQFDTASYALLYAFFAEVTLDGASFQDLVSNDYGTKSWNPNLAIPPLDSFVRIGGPVGSVGGSFTSPDPNWGDPGFTQITVPAGAGWYNSNPPSVQGQAVAYPWGNGTPVMTLVLPTAVLPVSAAFTASVIYNSAPGQPATQGSAMLEVELLVPFDDCNGNGLDDLVEIVGGVEDCDGDGIPDVCQGGIVDSDGDGVSDCTDGCPADPFKGAPGACGCGFVDQDGDADGTPDCIDGCPDDATKSAPGACGCGVSDGDSDGDGVPNCADGCPGDPAKTEPGACGCGVSDGDSDGDGVLNCADGCPGDPAKTEPGPCGCGVSERDSDADGVPDCADLCPGFDDGSDADGDGTPDGCEPPPCPADFDLDGVVGGGDLGFLLGQWGACPGCSADLDGDGVVGGADLGQLLGGWGECG